MLNHLRKFHQLSSMFTVLCRKVKLVLFNRRFFSQKFTPNSFRLQLVLCLSTCMSDHDKRIFCVYGSIWNNIVKDSTILLASQTTFTFRCRGLNFTLKSFLTETSCLIEVEPAVKLTESTLTHHFRFSKQNALKFKKHCKKIV